MAPVPHHRTLRLRDVLATPPGHVRLAVCTHCGHSAPLPIGGLLRRHTEFSPLAQALRTLRCSACGGYETIEAKLSLAE